jgi:hypothetical protein
MRRGQQIRILDLPLHVRLRLALIGVRDSVGVRLAYTRWPRLAEAWWRLCGSW